MGIGLLSAQSDWKLAKEKNGIKVYTRVVKEGTLKEFKAVMDITASMSDVKKVLLDINGYAKWQHKCMVSKLLKKVSDTEMYTYTKVDTPWPVTDRDLVLKYNIKNPSSKEFRIDFKAYPKYIGTKDDAVRLPYCTGYWSVKALSNGKVRVTNQAHSSAGGSVPAWLANSGVVDSPYNSFYNLKKKF